MNIFIRLFLNCLGEKELNSIKPGFSAFFYRKHLANQQFGYKRCAETGLKGRSGVAITDKLGYK